MKYLIIFIYGLITWFIIILINLLLFIYHLDFKHYVYYGTYFLTIKNHIKYETFLGKLLTYKGY